MPPERQVDDSLTFTSCRYAVYDSRHHDLYARCWSQHIREGTGKQITADQHRRLYDDNPSGPSVVTVAEEDGRWLGAVSAIATRMVGAHGVSCALQIGDFMVDASQQGRGIGFRLLEEQTRYLSKQPEPVYTFPNTRSIGLFLKQGYQELRRLRSTVFPLFRLGRRSAESRSIELEEAAALADAFTAHSQQAAGLRKDGQYLHWRYSAFRNTEDYGFVVVSGRESQDLLVVTTRFQFKGLPFLVILDAIPADNARPLEFRRLASVPSLAFGQFEQALPNLRPRFGWVAPPKFDPRPMRLLVPPDDAESAQFFSDCYFTTADSLGF